MDKTIAILQSNYIPWKGYFDIIRRVDAFILYDDVQYTRRDWRNRNKIKTPQGTAWLTIPVLSDNGRTARICDVETDGGDWAERHWRSFLHHYKGAPYFNALAPVLEEAYGRAAERRRLMDVNRLFIDLACSLLGISTPIASSLDYAAEGRKSERLLSLCLQAGATRYLSGPAAKDYLDEGLFAAHDIAVDWMDYGGYPEYPQLHPPFQHAVSVLDLLLNTGKAAISCLKSAV